MKREKELYKRLSADYEFDVVKALKERNFIDVANHLPIFMYNKKENKTYTLVDVKQVTLISDNKPRTYLSVKYWGVNGQEEDFYGFGDEPDYTSYHNTYGLVDEDLLLTDKLLDDYLPAFNMTDKQKAYLLKTYDEDELNYMCGKEAWTIIDDLVRKAKKEYEYRRNEIERERKYRDEYDEDDWRDLDSYLSMEYCGGGH